MDTKSILAELEDLGATGDIKPVTVQKVEEVRVHKGSPAPALLDERGSKMVRLADIVINELDNLIISASSMRDALTEMKEIWKPAVEDTVYETAETPQEDEYEYEDSEEGEAEYEDEEVAEELQGTPNAMGHIPLTVPAPVPLPPDIADLND
jgi:hypothetical protein